MREATSNWLYTYLFPPVVGPVHRLFFSEEITFCSGGATFESWIETCRPSRQEIPHAVWTYWAATGWGRRAEPPVLERKAPIPELLLDYARAQQRFYLHQKAGEAAFELEECRERAQELGLKELKWTITLDMGRASMALGRWDEAAERFQSLFFAGRRNRIKWLIPLAWLEQGVALILKGEETEGEILMKKALDWTEKRAMPALEVLVLLRMAQVYNHYFRFYGLALEYARLAGGRAEEAGAWPAVLRALEQEVRACQEGLETLDLARILGPTSLDVLKRKYLTGLLSHYVGLPGLETREKLSQRIGISRQAIYRNLQPATERQPQDRI